MLEKNIKIIHTEYHIQKAFIHLVKKKGFDHLTISAIVETAHISRGTFYKHYHDKFDLMRHYEDQSLRKIDEIFHNFPKPQLTGNLSSDVITHNAFFQMFNYLYSQRNLMSILLENKGNNFMFRMKKLIKDEVGLQSEEISTTKSFQIPPDFTEEIILQNIISIITYWINKRQPELPIEVFNIFIESRTLSPVDLGYLVSP
ncbi:TetR/AcrR family transcriptional regulator [Liquorilactobacillus ghanensis]|uniref:TetR/AcrR family transcriptional regulator n=2 Tax=Liquorilactobacillus TaxID=2767888 RepID=UPI0039EB1CFF